MWSCLCGCMQLQLPVAQVPMYYINGNIHVGKTTQLAYAHLHFLVHARALTAKRSASLQVSWREACVKKARPSASNKTATIGKVIGYSAASNTHQVRACACVFRCPICARPMRAYVRCSYVHLQLVQHVRTFPLIMSLIHMRAWVKFICFECMDLIICISTYINQLFFFNDLIVVTTKLKKAGKDVTATVVAQAPACNIFYVDQVRACMGFVMHGGIYGRRWYSSLHRSRTSRCCFLLTISRVGLCGSCDSPPLRRSASACRSWGVCMCMWDADVDVCVPIIALSIFVCTVCLCVVCNM